MLHLPLLALATAPDRVGRELYWNIEIGNETIRMITILIFGLIPLAVIIYHLWKRWKLWDSLGEGIEFPPREEWWPRTKRTLAHVFAQKRVRKKKGVGWSHVAIFWSFILLFIGTTIVAFQADIAQPIFGWYFFEGTFYLVYSFILTWAGLMGIAGCCYGLYVRHLGKSTLRTGKWDWTVHLWILLVILITGYMVSGARISGTGTPEYEKYVRFAGYFFSIFIPESSARSIHWGLWWFHFWIAIGWLAFFGSTAMSHIFTSTVNIWLARDIPSGATPRPIQNIEEAETFGVLTIDQFRNVHLRDADTCVECGRCTDVCPANLTGKPLSPKKIIQTVRDQWRENYEHLQNGKNDDSDHEYAELTTFITPDELWSCTTCGACEEVCPVMIEQVEKIVEMRRGLVLMKSEFPEEVMTAFNNMEQQGNPWGKSPDDRMGWVEQLLEETGIEVPVWGDEAAENAEYLFWVGCAGSYDAKAINITKSIAQLLHKADIKFAILGPAETCTGDSALRTGNEYLYQVLAQQNIETLKEAKVKKIIAQCPHCFQTLNKDYRLLDPSIEYEVVHHSEVLEGLLKDGRLKGGESTAKAILHDSCYLARHNNIESQPRGVASASLKGDVKVSEPGRCGKKGLCCGAGGGRMWMEEDLGDKKVNIERSEELLKDGHDTIVTSCPFCKTMLHDGANEVAGKDRNVRVLDIAELLLESQKENDSD